MSRPSGLSCPLTLTRASNECSRCRPSALGATRGTGHSGVAETQPIIIKRIPALIDGNETGGRDSDTGVVTLAKAIQTAAWRRWHLTGDVNNEQVSPRMKREEQGVSRECLMGEGC